MRHCWGRSWAVWPRSSPRPDGATPGRSRPNRGLTGQDEQDILRGRPVSRILFRGANAPSVTIPLGDALLHRSCCQPGPLGLKRPCGRTARGPYLALLLAGLAVPVRLPVPRWAFTPPFHLCPGGPGQSVLCGAFPRVTPAGRYPAPLPHGVRTFLDGRSAPAAATRPSARLLRILPHGSLQGLQGLPGKQPRAISLQRRAGGQFAGLARSYCAGHAIGAPKASAACRAQRGSFKNARAMETTSASPCAMI